MYHLLLIFIIALFMGPGVDAGFDEILLSFEKIAQKHAQQVVASIRRWPKAQLNGFGSPRMPFAKASRGFDSSALQMERKTLATVYVMCRALIAVTSSISKDGLPEAVGRNLEELMFDQLKRYDLKLSMQSANYRSIAELNAMLLGQLSDVRCVR